MQDKNMIINKNKSGVMYFKRGIRPPDGVSEINGYPIVTKYKYLGMLIDEDLDYRAHLKSINGKISYLTERLTVFRRKLNLKFIVNLFSIFIKPLYRLGYTLLFKAK
jgi:hypothetical protein